MFIIYIYIYIYIRRWFNLALVFLCVVAVWMTDTRRNTQQSYCVSVNCNALYISQVRLVTVLIHGIDSVKLM